MNATELLILIALMGYAIYRQTRVNEITGHGRFKLALIYGIVGIALGVHAPHDPAALGLLALGFALSIGVGLLRGRLTRLWRDADGRVLSQGTTLTVGLFLGLVAVKFALGFLAYLLHIPYESGLGEVLVMIALMVAMQAEIIWHRAQALGAGRTAVGPVAPYSR